MKHSFKLPYCLVSRMETCGNMWMCRIFKIYPKAAKCLENTKRSLLTFVIINDGISDSPYKKEWFLWQHKRQSTQTRQHILQLAWQVRQVPDRWDSILQSSGKISLKWNKCSLLLSGLAFKFQILKMGP